MAIQKFYKSEAIGFGWNTMKSNLGFFIALLIVGGLINFVLDFIAKKDASVLSIIISIASLLLEMVILMGLIRISLRLHDNEKGEFADLFSCFPLVFKYLVGSILYVLIVLGGTILLIIPGIIWAIRFQFFSYFIVDEGLGPIEALRRSSLITRGAIWELALLSSLLGLINLLGALCLLIGLFATIPTTMVAMAFVYRKLLTQTDIQGTETMVSRKKGKIESAAIIWAFLILLLLIWLPIIGPLIAGIVGGKKAGGVGSGILAVFLPGIVFGVGMNAIPVSLYSVIPLHGVIAGMGVLLFFSLVYIVPLFYGAIIGGILAWE
jgi:hypothetical protein